MYAVFTAVADRFAVDVDGVGVAVFPAAQGVRGGNQDDFAFQVFRKQFVEVAHLSVELGFFHVGDAEPDDLDVVRVCGFKDAVDAFQVFLRPFVGSEFEVLLADGEIPRVVRAEEYGQYADFGMFLQGFFNRFRPVEEFGIGKPRALFAEVDGFDAVLLFQAFLHEGCNTLHQRIAGEKDFVPGSDGGGVGVLFPFLDFAGLRGGFGCGGFRRHICRTAVLSRRRRFAGQECFDAV